MDANRALMMYLEFLEDYGSFPLMGNLQSQGDAAKIRWHVDKLIKDELLYRNDYKHILPGKNFLGALEELGCLDRWLTTRAGGLFMASLGVGKKSGFTVIGFVKHVDKEHAFLSWLGDSDVNPPEKLSRKILRKVWPPKVGSRLYLTTFNTKLFGFSVE